MSWSVAAIGKPVVGPFDRPTTGKPEAVAKAIVAQSAHACMEPEESIWQSALSLLATALESENPAAAVKVTAQCSQSEKYGPNGEHTGVFTNSLSIGFVE